MLVKLNKSQRIRVINSKDLFHILRDIHFCKHPFDQDKETFYAVSLSRTNVIQHIDEVSVGNLTGTIVTPRETFRYAILKGANSLVLCHNHPSGSTNPSSNDIEIMKQLVSAGKIVGIPIIDSLIITENSYYSFADEGMINY